VPTRTAPPRISSLTVAGDGVALDVTVVRKRIRRIYLGVHPPDGRVVVSAPLRASDALVRAAVLEDLRWVVRHRERILEEERRDARTRRPPARGRTGETWWVFGTPVPLEVREAPGSPRAALTPGALLLRAPAEADDARRLAAIERWQRRHLRAAAAPLVAAWSERLGVEPRFLGIRRMRTHWGTCEPQERRIWLALELVARPSEGLEYVVVHELVHLLEASHGPRFVRLMDEHLPTWRQRRAELDAGTIAGTFAPVGVAPTDAAVEQPAAPAPSVTGVVGEAQQLSLGLGVHHGLDRGEGSAA
jgi:predicted metal-dependent hydrolase